jgi:hypothetical protein
MDEQRFDHDESDAELLALQAVVTEFISQLNVEDPHPDETPPRPPVDTGHPVGVQPEPNKLVSPTATATPVIPATQELSRSNNTRQPQSARSVRRWSLSLPTWHLRASLVWGLLAVTIAGCVATAVGWWLAVGWRAQVAIDRGPVVQAQPLTPRAQTPHDSPSPARTRHHSKAVAGPPVRSPLVRVQPVRRAAAERRPLPAPVVELPVPAVSLATLGRASVVPSISERVAPLPERGAIVPPGIVYQELPRPLVVVGHAVSVLLVLIINEHGRVDRAFIGSMPVLPRYEQQLLQAAKTWRYTPAFQNGHAIPCRKTLRVTVPASARLQ